MWCYGMCNLYTFGFLLCAILIHVVLSYVPAVSQRNFPATFLASGSWCEGWEQILTCNLQIALTRPDTQQNWNIAQPCRPLIHCGNYVYKYKVNKYLHISFTLNWPQRQFCCTLLLKVLLLPFTKVHIQVTRSSYIIHYEILGSYLQKPLQHHVFRALF